MSWRSPCTVPMTAVVSNPRENIFLRPGDTLTLVRDPQTFLAVGATGANFEIPFSAEGITLAQALAKAGGLRDFQADPAGVFVFRFEPASVVRRLHPASPLLSANFVPVVYRINMRDPNSLFVSQAFRMRNRDLVYVSNAPFTEVQKVLSVFSTVTSPIASGALYARLEKGFSEFLELGLVEIGQGHTLLLLGGLGQDLRHRGHGGKHVTLRIRGKRVQGLAVSLAASRRCPFRH